MGVTTLTPSEFHAIVVIERVCSSLSLAGCAFICLTFISSRAFHKPINRLVFYASLGNIMTNIATLISRSGLNDIKGNLCQFQGFLIQMFMCADAYWTLAMACNVYLTFFHKYDAGMLRRMEKWYIVACYGIPFVPALVYIFITSKEGHRMYGDAALWCWISKDFDVVRIATFYAPVWVCILLTAAIYLRAGKEIYKKRKQLYSFGSQQRNSLNVDGDDPFSASKTTEVQVISQSITDVEQAIDITRLGRRPEPADQQLYSVSVSSENPHVKRAASSASPSSRGSEPKPPNSPISVAPSSPRSTRPAPHATLSRPYVSNENNANSAAWSYTKVAILFFTAMLVTWIPSSANRVYSVVNDGTVNTGLEFAAALVLPLQGFWNAVIYITTSWRATCTYFSDIFSCASIKRRSKTQGLGITTKGKSDRLSSRDLTETESTAELASRPSTRLSQR